MNKTATGQYDRQKGVLLYGASLQVSAHAAAMFQMFERQAMPGTLSELLFPAGHRTFSTQNGKK